MKEIEAKVKVQDLSAVRKRLTKLRATFKETEHEENFIFDRHGELWKQDSTLRLRKGNRVSFTFKGPQQKGRLKIRPEYQVDVSDFEEVKKILESLGFTVVFRYAKKREDYHYKDCTVSLDTLRGLGTFVEVEGPSTQKVLAVLKDLGFSGKEALSDSYVKLLLQKKTSSL